MIYADYGYENYVKNASGLRAKLEESIFNVVVNIKAVINVIAFIYHQLQQ